MSAAAESKIEASACIQVYQEAGGRLCCTHNPQQSKAYLVVHMAGCSAATRSLLQASAHIQSRCMC